MKTSPRRRKHRRRAFRRLFWLLVLATLPLVVFYLIMQKSIIEGVVAGSVKG